MKKIPYPLYLKMITTSVLGTACVLFSIGYYICRKDRILLYLSLLVSAFCTGKVIQLYSICKHEQYEIVEGTCVGVSRRVYGKLQTVKIMDDEGIESTVKISKNKRIKIGSKYRLYFALHGSPFQTDHTYLETAIATQNLLSYEEI